MRAIEGMLSDERLVEIRKTLVDAGHEAIANELWGHLAALDERWVTINQYYEEFLIPKMEQEHWAERVRESAASNEAKGRSSS
jgi:hypothetical protein